MTETVRLTPLDIHFADFIVRLNDSSDSPLWWAAALTSNAAGRGHSCFTLTTAMDVPPQAGQTALPATVQQWQQSLLACSTVGRPGDYTPLILDNGGRLYLQRNWTYEQQTATALLARCQAPEAAATPAEELLDRYFPADPDGVDLQRAAARMALTHRFSVISGGPGTGKTATVARIIALLRDSTGVTDDAIILAAPTGKAAMRLRQSIGHATGRLGVSADRPLPGNVQTIHRLLGMQQSGGFRHNRLNRITCDVIIIDEASMVDLQLMAALLEALPDHARVILLGDRHQLASVEAGAVLADICASAAPGGVPVTQLTRSYRFTEESGIAALARLITGGDGEQAVQLLTAEHYPDVRWRQLPGRAVFEKACMAAAATGYADYCRTLTPESALAALDMFRIIAPLHGGSYGVDTINRLCRATLTPGRSGGTDNLYHTPILMSGNTYELDLFNGDSGVIMESDAGQEAWFERNDGGVRRIAAVRLPPHDCAYAMTVHKSQGSEFDHVLLILPDQLSGLLTRELIYTAVTRARHSIEIWADEEIFRQAVEKRTQRDSGLQQMLTGDNA